MDSIKRFLSKSMELWQRILAIIIAVATLFAIYFDVEKPRLLFGAFLFIVFSCFDLHKFLKDKKVREKANYIELIKEFDLFRGPAGIRRGSTREILTELDIIQEDSELTNTRIVEMSNDPATKDKLRKSGRTALWTHLMIIQDLYKPGDDI